MQIDMESTWMEPFIRYIKTYNTPEGHEKGWIHKPTHYTMLNEELFCSWYSQPLLKRFTYDQASY